MKKVLRFLRHPLGITLIILILLTGGAFGARYVAWPFYKEWRENRWITMAERFHEQEDLRNAGLVLRKVIAANPASLGGWEMILKISKEEDGPGLLSIYRQVALLKPDDQELHEEWASTAVARGNFSETKTALEKLSDDTSLYHRLSAAVALGESDLNAAEIHFSRLLEMEPDDQQIALNLAIVHLQLPDEGQQLQARQKLRALAEADGTLRLAAIRALLTDAMNSDLADEAVVHMNALRAHPGHQFRDQLQILQTLDRYKRDEYDSYLTQVMARAQENVIGVRALARLLNGLAQRPTLRQWIESLPSEIQEDQEVNLQYIETLVFMNDLPALEERLRTLPWERDDFYRQAILSQTLRDQNRERESRETWQRAVIAAQDNIRDQRILYLQATSWNWQDERIDLASRIYQRNPRETWAFTELFAYYQQTRNTPEMTRLFTRQVEVDSSDIYARNNLAYLWLLQRSNLSRAYALAQEIYRREPDNPQFRTTYAFSLYRQGRHEESLSVFEGMDDEQKGEATRALHYSLILAANEKWEQARTIATNVPPVSFFPEEDRLLEGLKSQFAEHL